MIALVIIAFLSAAVVVSAFLGTSWWLLMDDRIWDDKTVLSGVLIFAIIVYGWFDIVFIFLI